ncbi:probable cyclin-dependent kinase 8 [Acropora millepora]|uniref:probable cyclin-dependent kinase 8 n=1 Tax=Acropora millepora TaxID=45264 RepID=UPI001CF1CFB7|nr:probable cyclin-dependent kinase 8 [Acropora millepora]
MSVFRKCKLPQLIRRGSPGSEIAEEIPLFKCSELPVKRRIGHGSFGDVYTTEYKSSGDTKCHTVVIKRMLQVLDQEEKKLFYKEIRLLNDLHHPNIVRLKGVSLQPLAMMLEYMYFDFKHFGQDGLHVHSLADFLPRIDEFNCEGLFELLNHAAKEIVNGLAHLHSKGIAHRDLKPANILISNQHYCTLSDENEIARQFECRPVACKVTDFGESRSLIVQTQSFVASRTNNIDRGTVVYEAPELFVKEMLLSDASIGDFMLADIWALGMIFFSLINPSVKYPYRSEIRLARNVSSQDQLKIFISSLVSQKKLPLADEKYAVERATVWRGLEDVYRGCANFDRHSRLSLEEAAKILSKEDKRVSDDLDVVQLKVSQATAVQQFDHRFAVQLKDNATNEPADQSENALRNDGTNACAFLSVKIADVILSEVGTGIEFFVELAKAIEATIWHLPEKINEHRDLHRMYDALEAYGILRKQKVVTSLYDFSEELLFADTVFSYEGRQKLHLKLCDLGCNDFVAVFTCEPLVLTIGCRDGKPYMIDTHPVTLAPGKGNGLMMIGKKNSSDVWLSLCIWLWNRLHYQGVTPDTCQSLAVVTSRSR